MPAVCCNRVLAGKGLGLAHGDSGAADESAPGCRLCQMTLAELDRSLLTAAAEEGLGPEIEALVEHGADVNAINHEGETSLIAAVYWGNSLECSRILVEFKVISAADAMREGVVTVARGGQNLRLLLSDVNIR